MRSLKTDYLYWACQVAGWGIYSAVTCRAALFFTGWHAGLIIGFALFFVYSIGLTHLLRAQIRRRDWLSLPAARGLPRVFGGAIGVGAIETALVIGLSRVLSPGYTYDLGAMLSTAGGVIFVTCVWAGLYVGISWNRRYRQSKLREVQLQLTLRQAELRALQSQVNPHFLFNSLNTIRGMVIEDPARAQQMITSLASLFRRALQSNGAQLVPLYDEMDAVGDYLALETTRFEERLEVSVEMEQGAEKCPVPAMLVQTLVENAVKHGISHLPRGGAVRVRGALERESLVLEVENSGTLKEPDPKSAHIGLDNARERLRLFYGERASLQLSASDGTVTARVVLPQNL
jgi:LytS/YehU family sensor histidine kinase